MIKGLNMHNHLSSDGLHRRQALQIGLSACLAGAGLAAAPAAVAAADATGSDRTGSITRRSETFLFGKDDGNIPPPPTPRAAEHYIDVPNGRLKYLDTGGSGPPIVLLHAATGTARAWDYQLPALAGAGYRVIAPWRRGTSESASGAPPTIALETADLAALAEGLGLQRFHLVGTASGGFIAIRFAVDFAPRLLTLTLANSLLGINEPDYQRIIELLLPDGFQAMPSEFKELSGTYRVSNPQGVERWLEIEAGSIAAKLSQRPDMAKAMRAGVRGTNGPTYANLSALNLPVHLIYGDADLYAPPALARQLTNRFGNARLTILGESGHAGHWEQPDNFNAAVMHFLEQANSR